MDDERETWPWMVRLGLLGLPGRGAAWACFWLLVALAIGCIALGFVEPWAFPGGLFVFAALWYYLAIGWVDDHGRWS